MKNRTVVRKKVEFGEIHLTPGPSPALTALALRSRERGAELLLGLLRRLLGGINQLPDESLS